MSEQPQPNPQTVIKTLSGELGRVNDNRLWLMAMLEETKAEALAEIAKRDQEIAELKAHVVELEGPEVLPFDPERTDVMQAVEPSIP
jgi:hypothetical protein